MGRGSGDWFQSTDWKELLEHFSNDKIISFFTRPVGLGVLGVLLLLSVVNKWRVLFVVISGTMAVSFLVRSTLATGQVGPGRSLFVFAGGAIAIGAFAIYFLFIRED
jgi:predicted membrane channel-forming protein YqfA (hemolysin III family)